MTPLRAALIAQIAGGLVTFAFAQWVLPELWRVPVGLAAIQGGCAAVVARGLKTPVWWLAIHLLFMPLVVLARGLEIPPGWYLAGFVLMLLVFWRTDRSRVPLYLSNEKTAAALAMLLPSGPCQVIDLGCGDGRLIRHLARARPDCRFLGIEHAPLPWLWAWFGSLGLRNCRVRYGDFWQESLHPYDLVYAFLSPVPMTQLWVKASGEMRPPALLVSNSFPVPDQEPRQTVQVDDRRATRLLCYRPASR